MATDPLLPPKPLERLLEVHEVAYHLKCSQETVRRFIRERQLAVVHLTSRALRVDPKDLQAFIAARKQLQASIARAEEELDQRLGLTPERPRPTQVREA